MSCDYTVKIFAARICEEIQLQHSIQDLKPNVPRDVIFSKIKVQ